jgi:hypothetical protein
LFIATAFPVVNLIAVADVQPLLGAVPPDRVLNEPRKRPGKLAVELPGVDLLGDRLDDVGAAVLLGIRPKTLWDSMGIPSAVRHSNRLIVFVCLVTRH